MSVGQTAYVVFLLVVMAAFSGVLYWAERKTGSR